MATGIGEETTFGDLAVGDAFVFSAYSRSGLLADIKRPGEVVYEKISLRKWRRLDNLTEGQIGSAKARCWHFTESWEEVS